MGKHKVEKQNSISVIFNIVQMAQGKLKATTLINGNVTKIYNTVWILGFCLKSYQNMKRLNVYKQI